MRQVLSIVLPLFVFEGTGRGNIAALRTMVIVSTNPLTHFHPVQGFTHFNILGPTNELIAAKVHRDDGPTTQIAFSEAELNALGR